MAATPKFPILENWEDAAACRGADLALFYAPNYFERKVVKDAREARAKSYCRACPVREACLDYAMAMEEGHGVWGGLNERERRRLRRRMAREDTMAAS